MIYRKIIYSFRNRGIWGILQLVVNYIIWYWKKLFSKNRYFLKKVHNYKMYLNLDDPGISTTLGRGGIREKAYTTVLQEELHERMVVLDIGANLGYYALMEASLVGSSGKVYAVEPVPDNYNLLVKNVKLNNFENIVETFPIAISDSIGKRKLYLSYFSNLNTLFPGFSNKNNHMTGKYIEVDTLDIGTFIKRRRKIELIRMDIEGAEVEIFNGMLKIIEKDFFTPKILFETHFSRYDKKQHNMERPLSKLFNLGYFVKRFISNNDDGTKWHTRGYKPDAIVNTDGMTRGIYSHIAKDDAIELICYIGGVRAVLLAVA